MIRAIDTKYNGYRFRSRLEARWAVFFDSLRIEYEYEKEGFKLPSGQYLPDFWLPELRSGVWVEIKPSDKKSDATHRRRITELAAHTGQEVILFKGDPLSGVERYARTGWPGAAGSTDLSHSLSGYDSPYLFCICPTCGAAGLEYEGRAERICAHGAGDKHRNPSHPRIMTAATAARQARFEFGEVPVVKR